MCDRLPSPVIHCRLGKWFLQICCWQLNIPSDNIVRW